MPELREAKYLVPRSKDMTLVLGPGSRSDDLGGDDRSNPARGFGKTAGHQPPLALRLHEAGLVCAVRAEAVLDVADLLLSVDWLAAVCAGCPPSLPAAMRIG
jgi:hypothetical protein